MFFLSLFFFFLSFFHRNYLLANYNFEKQLNSISLGVLYSWIDLYLAPGRKKVSRGCPLLVALCFRKNKSFKIIKILCSKVLEN